ncbi:hypothetical protein PAPHI01_0457 [Pancytospora philotis]|nr:hypothetical protein PAPHI01_0457 [Pancytospora philotis]
MRLAALMMGAQALCGAPYRKSRAGLDDMPYSCTFSELSSQVCAEYRAGTNNASLFNPFFVIRVFEALYKCVKSPEFAKTTHLRSVNPGFRRPSIYDMVEEGRREPGCGYFTNDFNYRVPLLNLGSFWRSSHAKLVAAAAEMGLVMPELGAGFEPYAAIDDLSFQQTLYETCRRASDWFSDRMSQCRVKDDDASATRAPPETPELKALLEYKELLDRLQLVHFMYYGMQQLYNATPDAEEEGWANLRRHLVNCDELHVQNRGRPVTVSRDGHVFSDSLRNNECSVRFHYVRLLRHVWLGTTRGSIGELLLCEAIHCYARTRKMKPLCGLDGYSSTCDLILDLQRQLNEALCEIGAVDEESVSQANQLDSALLNYLKEVGRGAGRRLGGYPRTVQHVFARTPLILFKDICGVAMDLEHLASVLVGGFMHQSLRHGDASLGGQASSAVRRESTELEEMHSVCRDAQQRIVDLYQQLCVCFGDFYHKLTLHKGPKIGGLFGVDPYREFIMLVWSREELAEEGLGEALRVEVGERLDKLKEEIDEVYDSVNSFFDKFENASSSHSSSDDGALVPTFKKLGLASGRGPQVDYSPAVVKALLGRYLTKDLIKKVKADNRGLFKPQSAGGSSWCSVS